MSLQKDYDMVVVGGGIHGAGVAQAAAAAGYSTLLLEKTDWAAGTSSKSSKLIHGGLRYLQGGHLRLVWESLRERETLLRIAPHLVNIENFYIPVYRHSQIRAWQLRAGLSVYALLGGLHKHSKFATVPQKKWPDFTGLNTCDLQHLFCYQDAQTDDDALTRAVVASAHNLGATLCCPAALTQAQHITRGYELQITLPAGPQRVTCGVLVNCAGPWINRVAERISPTPAQMPVDLVQGAHLILAPAVSQQRLYLESPTDGRAVFLLPWRGQSLLGTTETLFTGDPDKVCPLPEEEAYLLAIFRHYFPDSDTTVVERMAGLRVLPKSSTNPFKRNREVHLITCPLRKPAYIAVYGGKLTGYRATAAKVIALAEKRLGPRATVADTENLRLPDLSTELSSDPGST